MNRRLITPIKFGAFGRVYASVPPNILQNIFKSAWAALPNTRIIPEYSCSLFWYSAVQLRQTSPGRPEYSVVHYPGGPRVLPGGCQVVLGHKMKVSESLGKGVFLPPGAKRDGFCGFRPPL